MFKLNIKVNFKIYIEWLIIYQISLINFCQSFLLKQLNISLKTRFCNLNIYLGVWEKANLVILSANSSFDEKL